MAKLKSGYIRCPVKGCNQQFSNIRYLISHIKERHPRAGKEYIKMD